MGNILGIALTSRQPEPVLVLVCLSLDSKYSSSSTVSSNFTSPKHRSMCSLQPLSPKCTVLFIQRMFNNPSGFRVPKWPFSKSVFNSSLVKAIEAFGLFPFPFFFKSFCLDRRTFLVYLNTRAFMTLGRVAVLL